MGDTSSWAGDPGLHKDRKPSTGMQALINSLCSPWMGWDQLLECYCDFPTMVECNMEL